MTRTKKYKNNKCMGHDCTFIETTITPVSGTSQHLSGPRCYCVMWQPAIIVEANTTVVGNGNILRPDLTDSQPGTWHCEVRNDDNDSVK